MDYYTEDITWCSKKDCGRTTCERNRKRIRPTTKPLSFADLEHTDYCPKNKKNIPISKEVEQLLTSYNIEPDEDFDIYKTAVDMAFTTKGALAILKNMLFRPHARANDKVIMTATFDIALCRAIIALEKELKEEKKNES